MKAALVISHGSRSAETKKEVEALVMRLKKKSGWPLIRLAFLEIEHPSISEGVDECVEHGATEIKVLMSFLNSGRHVDQDVPRILDECRKKYPQVKIIQSSPVGQHPVIDDLFLELLGN
ncbi:MAG: CbiX/SirB N-terminal domain-containing protein [Candidatus Omnitrophota bacterium]|nr:CbiX/SirB N-terminal domain-containing protein [Candidatus Omnitrophota bacterium]